MKLVRDLPERVSVRLGQRGTADWEHSSSTHERGRIAKPRRTMILFADASSYDARHKNQLAGSATKD